VSFVVIECGSAARGDSNENSDVDRVCIWSGRAPKFSSISKKYGDIMFYSQHTIGKMKEKGSLFLTHLDVDSQYIAGDISLLKQFKGFRPLESQTQKLFDETSEFIASVAWFPDSNIGRLWLCDLLYVSLRSCIYCKNAGRGQYLFGFVEALRAFQLSESDIKTLLELREGKYAYRKTQFAKVFDFDLKSIESVCQAVLGLQVRFNAGGATDWLKIARNDYWGERLVERAILNMEHRDDQFMAKMLRHNYNKFTLRSDITRIVGAHT